METIYIILGLIMLVFGILQIILFFKLWKLMKSSLPDAAIWGLGVVAMSLCAFLFSFMGFTFFLILH